MEPTAQPTPSLTPAAPADREFAFGVNDFWSDPVPGLPSGEHCMCPAKMAGIVPDLTVAAYYDSLARAFTRGEDGIMPEEGTLGEEDARRLWFEAIDTVRGTSGEANERAVAMSLEVARRLGWTRPMGAC